MKLFLKVTSVLGLMLMIGCSNSSNELRPVGGVCNNPSCQCVKPCQCGAGCQCGKNGNSKTMADDTAK